MGWVFGMYKVEEWGEEKKCARGNPNVCCSWSGSICFALNKEQVPLGPLEAWVDHGEMRHNGK